MMKHTVLLITTTLLLVGCGVRRAGFNEAKINHVVVFGLQNSMYSAELISDCDTKLSTTKGSVSYWGGVPGSFGRKTVDGEYDVCVYVGLESNEAYQNYLDHPNHTSLVKNGRIGGSGSVSVTLLVSHHGPRSYK
jgi:hypothetical protein